MIRNREMKSIMVNDLGVVNNELTKKVLDTIGKENIQELVEQNSHFRELMVGYRCAIMEIETKFKVLNEVELNARYEIKNETFLKKVQIESRIAADMAANHIIPTAIRYQNVLIENIKGINEVFPSQLEDLAKDEIETLKEIISHVNAIRSASAVMVETRHKLNRNPDIPERAKGYEKDVRSKMSEMREHIDALEMIIDDELWPLPKYRELLATL